MNSSRATTTATAAAATAAAAPMLGCGERSSLRVAKTVMSSKCRVLSPVPPTHVRRHSTSSRPRVTPSMIPCAASTSSPPPPPPPGIDIDVEGDSFFGGCVRNGGVIDFYEVLGVSQNATNAELKRAYHALARRCHPDRLGNEMGHSISVLLNEAYATLTDKVKRQNFDSILQAALLDEEEGFTGEMLSKWTTLKADSVHETRGIFVNESSCIGCRLCADVAPDSFTIEPVYGRARVSEQWVSTEDELQAAIDSCPVDCIHWVDKEELPFLEHVMTKMPRMKMNVMRNSFTSVVSSCPFQASEELKYNREVSRDTHACSLATKITRY